jgi:hypothetical protein
MRSEQSGQSILFRYFEALQPDGKAGLQLDLHAGASLLVPEAERRLLHEDRPDLVSSPVDRLVDALLGILGDLLQEFIESHGVSSHGRSAKRMLQDLIGCP